MSRPRILTCAIAVVAAAGIIGISHPSNEADIQAVPAVQQSSSAAAAFDPAEEQKILREAATRKAAADRAARQRAEAEAERAAAQAEAERVAAEQAAAQAEAERVAAEQAAKDALLASVEAIVETSMWTTDPLNVRTGPSVDFEKVGGLAAGTEVRVNGKHNGFYRMVDGRFVSGHYLTTNDPAPAVAAERPRQDGGESPVTAEQPRPQPAGQPVAWKTWVANYGGQAAADACTGGLTHYTDFDIGRPYYPIHRGCGGAPILGLNMGDLVQIGETMYRVVDAKVVSYYHSTTDDLLDVAGDALLQTCYKSHDDGMRVVGIARV